ncbi:MAG: metallophosphoesterase [Oscillospiraceae bacterium]|nr:metallophosphoesterase [Oscillospiraceae bacterium]
MALYAIGDLHLSLGTDKSMEVFGGGWQNYVVRLQDAFAKLHEDDVTVLCGDLSWGMSLDESLEDLRFINALPGRKILVKGNHDYWWNTAAKMTRFFSEHGLDKLEILHNNCLWYGDTALCGTRGWFYELDGGAQNEKLLAREAGRLETSLQCAGTAKKLCFLHYPPLYQGYNCPQVLELLRRYGVSACCYGHLHGVSHRRAVEGSREGTAFSLVSADYLGFVPKKICD